MSATPGEILAHNMHFKDGKEGKPGQQLGHSGNRQRAWGTGTDGTLTLIAALHIILRCCREMNVLGTSERRNWHRHQGKKYLMTSQLEWLGQRCLTFSIQNPGASSKARNLSLEVCFHVL